MDKLFGLSPGGTSWLGGCCAGDRGDSGGAWVHGSGDDPSWGRGVKLDIIDASRPVDPGHFADHSAVLLRKDGHLTATPAATYSNKNKA